MTHGSGGTLSGLCVTTMPSYTWVCCIVHVASSPGSPPNACELVREMTFELPLIFTGIQRSLLAIITHMQRREPGDEATVHVHVYARTLNSFMCCLDCVYSRQVLYQLNMYTLHPL